jgi:hypothetical protein
MKTTVPGIFLIESGSRKDEQHGLRERIALEEILGLEGRPFQHYYIRTEKELRELITEYSESNYRYLHLACHGDSEGKGISLTYDDVSFPELATILAPALNEKRLFVSACDSTRTALAKPIFRSSTCYSVIGPRGDINFHDAALAWAVFYSLMSRVNRKVMKQQEIKDQLHSVCKLLKVSFNGFFNVRGLPHLEVFRPNSTK